MKRLLLFLVSLLALACARKPVGIPEPVAQGAELFADDRMALSKVFFMPYPFAAVVIDTVGKLVQATGVERALCITRWNSLWKGDTLRAIELFAVVPLPALIANDTTLTPVAEVGNCWWRFPSIHWHLYDNTPTDRDFIFAAHSQAPFHIVATGAGSEMRFRLYAIRPEALKRDNPR